MMAKMLGISEKTIEKWEQGANPIKGAASRILYLLDRHPDLVSELYRFKKEMPKHLVTEDEPRKCCTVRAYALDCLCPEDWVSRENDWCMTETAEAEYVLLDPSDNTNDQGECLLA